jgi:hypothetical protein
MQINSKISYLTSKRTIAWLKTIIFLIVVFALYQLIKSKVEHFDEFKQSFEQLLLPKNKLFIVIIVLLTPINWAFEAWKWQNLANKIEKTSFWEAYKGVLIGLTFATATPMMIGDYAGKILMLKTDKRLQSIGAILLGNSLQLYVSLLFGTISYLFFGVFLSLNFSNIDRFLSKNKLLKYLKKYLLVLENYTLSELRNLFFIAISRYFVFSIQFLLMFKIFQINLPNTVIIAGIGIIFLSKTIISIFNALGDLSVRELTSVYYFSFFGANIAAISSATFMIWLINVLLPIMIGSLFILQLKLTPKNS